MQIEPRAFTVEHNGLVNVLMTQATIFNSLKPDKITTVNAIWDTGATNSCISEKIANQLDLDAVGYVRMNTAAGTFDTKRYLVDIVLPNKIVVRKVQVTEAVLNNWDVIIGMDIICLGDFAISNYQGKTRFSFRIPSIQDVDYCITDK